MHRVMFVEVVIDLNQPTVDPVAVGQPRGMETWIRCIGPGIHGEQARKVCQRHATGAETRQLSAQRGDSRSGGLAGADQVLRRGSNTGDRDWALNGAHGSQRVLLSFIIEKVEQFVFLDGAANGTAVLLQAEWRFLLGSWVEVVPGIPGIRAAISVGGAMNRIGTRLDPDVDNCAGLPTVFRPGILLSLEFLDGVD